MSLRNFLSIFAASLIAPFVFAADIEQWSDDGSIVLKSYNVATSYTFTNDYPRLVKPVSISFSLPAGTTNGFSVKHVRVDRKEQFSTNNFLQATNTIVQSTTNYWLLHDAERSLSLNQISVTNDESIAFSVLAEPYLGFGDIITFSNTLTNSVRTHVVYKEQ